MSLSAKNLLMAVLGVTICLFVPVLAPASSDASSDAPSDTDSNSFEAPSTGPLIEAFGPVFAIENPRNPAPLDQELKAAFDVSAVAPTPDAVNPRIETVARYLNMHAASGVPAEKIGAALVLHGGASGAALTNQAYQRRYGVDNPNLGLLQALNQAGVAIYLCGQSAASRGIAPDEVSAPVNLALSAMTAHVQLQAQGFALIPF